MTDDGTDVIDRLDMYFVTSIDTDKLRAVIQLYRDAHPQKNVGDDSDTHAMMADLLNDFVDRELGAIPQPMSQLEWPQILWTGLANKYGLFDGAVPELQLIQANESLGDIFFNGNQIGRFMIITGKQVLKIDNNRNGEAAVSDDDFVDDAVGSEYPG